MRTHAEKAIAALYGWASNLEAKARKDREKRQAAAEARAMTRYRAKYAAEKCPAGPHWPKRINWRRWKHDEEKRTLTL